MCANVNLCSRHASLLGGTRAEVTARNTLGIALGVGSLDCACAPFCRLIGGDMGPAGDAAGLPRGRTGGPPPLGAGWP